MARAVRRVAVTFDHDTHQYRVGGHVVPGVTTLLKIAGVAPGAEWYTDAARDRGRCVHEACMDLDLGVSHGCTHGDHQGYIDSYCRWRDMIDHQWQHVEEPRYSDAYGVAGIADRVGIVRGFPTVLDLKTGGVQKWHPLQFALYDLIYGELPPRLRRRIGLYLKSDGRIAQMLPFNDPSDYDRALWAVRKATA